MVKCEVCNKEFETIRQLGGHKSIHREGGRYSVSRKKGSTPTVYNCLFCNKECDYHRSSINKFCDNQCQAKYKWEYETKPRIEEGTSITTNSTLKKYLIESRGEKCEVCNIGAEWNGKYLSLQVDHIDGNSDNNYLSNVRLICPNCHAQTDTFSGKGMGSRYKKFTKRNTYLQEYKKGR